MSKGGYKIIDFKDININVGDSVVIDGIYESLEGNYRKPTLVSNLVIDNIERCDRFVVFGVDGQDYVGNLAINGDVYVLICTITPEDVVTLEEK